MRRGLSAIELILVLVHVPYIAVTSANTFIKGQETIQHQGQEIHVGHCEYMTVLNRLFYSPTGKTPPGGPGLLFSDVCETDGVQTTPL